MKIEKLQSLSDEILDELLIVWEKSFVIRNENGRIAAFMGLSDNMLEMLFVLPEEQGHGYGKAFVDYAINKCNTYKVDVNISK